MKLREIERLRAAALLMVLLGHLPIAVPQILIHGYTGVSIFFVISGYVCSLSFFRNQTGDTYRNKLQSVGQFWLSRFFRVIPLVICWILIYFVIGHIINYYGGSYGDTARFIKEFQWWGTGFYNYYFAFSRQSGLFGHLWTMAIEIQFYFILPLFFLCFHSRKSQSIACIVIIFVSTLSRFFTPDDLIGKLTHTQVDSLFAGVFIYVNKDSMRSKCLSRIRIQYRSWVGLIGIVSLFLLPVKLDYVTTAVVKYPFYTIIASFLVYLAQLDEGWIFPGKHVSYGLEKIATVSFSTYVSHVIIYSGLYYNLYQKWLVNQHPRIESHLGVWIQIIFLILAALFVGKISLELIEKPFAAYSKIVIKKMKSFKAVS